jgi:hypothetical protein
MGTPRPGRAPVRAAVVDRLVAAAAHQLPALVAERHQRRRVRQADHITAVHHPDRLRRRLQHSGKKLPGIHVEAGQIEHEIGHRKGLPARPVYGSLPAPKAKRQITRPGGYLTGG